MFRRRSRDVTDFDDAGVRQRGLSDVIALGVPVLGRHGGGRGRKLGVWTDVPGHCRSAGGRRHGGLGRLVQHAARPRRSHDETQEDGPGPQNSIRELQPISVYCICSYLPANALETTECLNV